MGFRTTVLVSFILASTLTILCPLSFVFCPLSLVMGFSASDQRPATNDQRPATNDQHVLLPGALLERELRGGEAHSYRLTLAAGQYVHAVVDQRGIEVALKLHGPDGQPIFPFYAPSGLLGPKEFSLVAEVTGDYRLELRSVEKDAEPGRYEVTIREWREATAAERLFAEGQRLVGQATADSLRQAIQKYQEARALWQAEGNRRGEAEALTAMGGPYAHLGQMGKALESLAAARALWHDLDDRRREAFTLNSIAFLHQFSDQREKALESFSQALLLWRTLGDRAEEADALSALGAEYYRLGEPTRAMDYINQALPLYRIVRDRRGQAIALNDTGLVYQSLGELQKALKFFNQALALHRNRRDARSEGIVLTNISLTYYSLGEPQLALQYLDQALQIRRAGGFRREEAHSLHNIGMIHHALGEPQKALEYLRQALQLQQSINHRRGEAYALTALSRVYLALGEKSKALEACHRALALFQTIGDKYGQASALDGMGGAYDELGETVKALDAYQQALALRRAITDRSGEASTRVGLARVERNLGNLNEARTHIETALTIVESQRRQLASPDLRASFLASKENYYEFYVDLLMRLHRQQPSAGYDAEALQAAERARARALLEILTEAHADIRQGVDPVLLQHERDLRQRLNAKSERLAQILSGQHTEEQKAVAEKEVSDLLRQYQDVQMEIRVRSPRYAALTQPQPLGLKEIQQQVLDADTMLLVYALGEERSFLWAVMPTSITSFELPKRAEIETAAQRVYELLMKKNETLDPDAFARLSQMLLGPVADQLTAKRLVIVSDGALQYVPFGALPEPDVRPRTSGVRHQTSDFRDQSSEIRLQTSDFRGQASDLGRQPPATSDQRPATNYQPLIVKHEVVSLPSASVLAVLRRELVGRQVAAKTVAVLADPVFETSDPRVSRSVIRSSKSGIRNKIESQAPNTESKPPIAIHRLRAEALTRSARQVGLNGFPRLKYSRHEAEQIIALVTKGQGLKATDFTASKAMATSPTLRHYRVVHFATHGLLNSEQPELSGVVLSLVDEQGRPQDGFLRLHDVYNLNLNADVVVLSACQTALGKSIKGEGLVGITRGFMYAGAARVVASLWEVEDVATARLMKRFYQEMLAKGQRPAAALRAAQVSLWEERRWKSPYYWAGFIFQGEWR